MRTIKRYIKDLCVGDFIFVLVNKRLYVEQIKLKRKDCDKHVLVTEFGYYYIKNSEETRDYIMQEVWVLFPNIITFLRYIHHHPDAIPTGFYILSTERKRYINYTSSEIMKMCKQEPALFRYIFATTPELEDIAKQK